MRGGRMTDKEIIDGLYEIKNWKCNGDSKMHSIIRGAIDLLEQTRWIPVTERLPEKDEWVLITFDNDIEIALLDDDGWCYSSVGNDDWIAEHPPVAWMSLPEPYKAESEE